MISEFPGLEVRFTNNNLIFEPRTIVNYSVSVKQLHGQAYVLCGNSTEFLDTIFSSSITLEIASGCKAADLVAKKLNSDEIDWDKQYSEVLNSGINVFRSYVNSL